jgi:hypothetical protein
MRSPTLAPTGTSKRFLLYIHSPLPSSTHNAIRIQEIIERPFVPEELRIPKKLQRDLPYALKPKLAADELIPPAEKRRREAPTQLVRKCTALVLEPEESRLNSLMQVLHTVRSDKVTKEQAAAKLKHEQHAKVSS